MRIVLHREAEAFAFHDQFLLPDEARVVGGRHFLSEILVAVVVWVALICMHEPHIPRF